MAIRSPGRKSAGLGWVPFPELPPSSSPWRGGRSRRSEQRQRLVPANGATQEGLPWADPGLAVRLPKNIAVGMDEQSVAQFGALLPNRTKPMISFWMNNTPKRRLTVIARDLVVKLH